MTRQFDKRSPLYKLLWLGCKIGAVSGAEPQCTQRAGQPTSLSAAWGKRVTPLCRPPGLSEKPVKPLLSNRNVYPV